MVHRCEALIEIAYKGRMRATYTMCGVEPAELHHKLLRSRGGVLLDEAGEKYHQIHLCRQHHDWCHKNVALAIEGGLIIEGYISTNPDGSLCYDGPNTYLKETYPK